MVGIVAMVVVLAVSEDAPIVTPAAPKVASAQPESAVSVPPVVVVKAETAESFLLKMKQEYWPELQRKAAAGDAEAQWQFGFTEMRGTFGEPDVEAGIRWMEKAAAQKHGRALNSLGEVYTTGEMVPQDNPKAISYFQSAWAAGEPSGILNLGILSEYGVGRLQDNAEAVRCYRLAAAKGSAAALTRLGAMYSAGDILPKDLKETVACYRAAAAKGSADAWHNLSVMHRRGIVVPLDKEAALACAEKAWAAGGLNDALMVADLLVELRGDYPRAMAYVTLYYNFNRSPEAREQAIQRAQAWDEKLKSEADRRMFLELEEALFLAEWRRRSKEIFGR